MKIKILQDDKISKKKYKVKKTAKKKSKSSYVRNTDLTINNNYLIGRSTRKKKVNKKFIVKTVFLIFIICLCFSTLFAYNRIKTYLCSIERFFIDSIEITGYKNVTKSEIKNLLPFKEGDSSIGINLGQIEKDLKEQKSELKNITISRIDWGKKIVISLTERLPEVFINIDDKKKGLDFDNKPFNLRGNMASMKIPTLKFENDEQRSALLNFYSKTKNYIPNLISEIEEIEYDSIDEIILRMNNNTYICWGLPKENKIEEKAIKLQQVLNDLSKKSNNVKSIDLSFLDDNKNKVIVKFVTEKENNV